MKGVGPVLYKMRKEHSAEVGNMLEKMKDDEFVIPLMTRIG